MTWLGSLFLVVATLLNNRGETLRREGRYGEAAHLLKQSIIAWETLLGPDHPNVAIPLNNLALVDLAQGRLTSAEKRLRRVLRIRRQAFGDGHPLLAITAGNLAVVLGVQGRRTEAALLEAAIRAPAGASAVSRQPSDSILNRQVPRIQ